MNFIRFFAAVAVVATSILVFAAPASAQATRTWVSGVGDDANPCSRTAPCKTFAGAISKTAASGEIDCLDPGGFGAVTITKSITIDCTAPGGIGGLLVSGTNGILVAAASTDTVQLIGLDINGVGNGLNGIKVQTAGNVAIIDCLIYGFGSTNNTDGNGVLITASTALTVFVQNTIIRNNAKTGIDVVPSGGARPNLELDHSFLDDNNVATGVTGGNLTVGTAAIAYLNASSLTGAHTAITNSGTVYSYGNNFLVNAITGTPISPQALH